jgi:hypothetical protein
MLALVAVLLGVSALAWVVLLYERGRHSEPAQPAGSPLPGRVGPTFVNVAPGGTVIVASQVAYVDAATPAPGDAPPVRVVPSTRVAAAYGALPRGR